MAAYTIVGFNKQIGQLLVRFHPEIPPLAVDVPIENGAYITGDALDTYIQNFIPVAFIQRLEEVKNGVANEAALESLVVPEVVPNQPNGSTPSATTV